ncbi:MAG: histidine decarboxylase [Cyanobacteriota bacterium]|nr:histidine decarboxylase [Cyanobacteriota bacterium]
MKSKNFTIQQQAIQNQYSSSMKNLSNVREKLNAINNNSQATTFSPPLPEQQELLKALEKSIAESTEFFIGYPLNLNFDYTPLIPFFQYLINNLGDPWESGYWYIQNKSIEQQCISWLAELYHLEAEWGYVTSCGTEGNIYGMFLGRELLPDAILYSSKDTHYSIAKAACMLKIPHVVINSQPNGEIDYEHLKQEISKRTNHSVILNLNLGTTMRGAVDRIEPTVDILEKLKIPFYIHCDGALGGMLLPYMETAPKISFQDYPIGSIAVSGHKFFGSPIPYGIVLTRKIYTDKIRNQIEYIGCNDTTITGSRSGLACLFLWYAIMTRGQQFAGEVSTCLENTRYLYKRLEEIGYKPFLNDFSTTVVFDKPSIKICKKWQLATQGSLAHIVVMQHLSQMKIDLFINDLLA